MRVLAFNCGSSSLRFGMFDVAKGKELSAGAVEEVSEAADAWRELSGPLESLPEKPEAVGHRVVHGGEDFTEAALIDAQVLAAVEAQIPLAPSHNPRCLDGIRRARALFPDVPHVAVFDTAFHQSMPRHVWLYALPYELYQKDRIRRYGFHGTSHRYAAERAATLLGRSADAIRVISCHLGNGCSITAVKGGRAVDTTMGMTPAEGLMMGTRSGDLDPAIALRLADELGPERAATLLSEESGLLGVSGVSSDLRRVEAAADAGNERARTAIEMFAHRVRRGIGAALAVLGGADAVTFTGGIGGGATTMRERILTGLGALGMQLDVDANRDCTGREGRISTQASPIALLVIPAREEWLIARETASTLERN